ncbi:MAG: hypothetical protein HY934_09460 [Candidatus Firestonebacteria bacterium]|nr:hypothetical protein [Candidatus Firestonebacteria bacterium]
MKKAFLYFSFIMYIILFVSNIHAKEEKDITLTIYKQNFALVREVRVIELKKGDVNFDLENIPVKIEPESIFFEVLNNDRTCQILNQKFEFDLLSTDKILSKYLDISNQIKLISKDGKTTQGKLINYDDKYIVLGEIDTETEPIIINRDNIAEIKLPEYPKGLIVKPVIHCKLRSSKKDDFNIAISYKTRGIKWEASYIGILNPDDTQLVIFCNIKITNKSGLNYEDAKINLVGGDINCGEKECENKCSIQGKSVLDNCLYSLDNKLDLKDKTINYISLFNYKTAKVNKKYTYNAETDGNKVRTLILVKNDEQNGIGIPLPEGNFKLHKKDNAGNTILIGESIISNVPVGKEIEIVLDEPINISAEKRKMELKKVSEDIIEKAYEIEINNSKEVQVDVFVTEKISGDWEIVEKSDPFEKKDAFTIQFLSSVPAKGKKVIKYRVRIKH